jgi:hypothetical protein
MIAVPVIAVPVMTVFLLTMIMVMVMMQRGFVAVPAVIAIAE